MIIPDKKKTASIIVSKMGGDKMHAEKPTDDMSGDDPGLSAAAEDILQAIADKSSMDLKSALKAFLQMADKDEMPEEG